MPNEDNNFDYSDKTINLFNAFHRDLTEGYESPITGYVNNIVEQTIEARDNAVCATIREQYAIDVNREELIKALNYDRGQYNKGYSDGYKDAQQRYAREWVSADDELPEDMQRVLIWFEYYRYGDFNCMYQTYGFGYVCDGKWSPFINGETGWQDYRVIAWQPLPEPYRESDEE